jgi:hypothetical protein
VLQQFFGEAIRPMVESGRPWGRPDILVVIGEKDNKRLRQISNFCGGKGIEMVRVFDGVTEENVSEIGRRGVVVHTDWQMPPQKIFNGIDGQEKFKQQE